MCQQTHELLQVEDLFVGAVQALQASKGRQTIAAAVKRHLRLAPHNAVARCRAKRVTN
jgi:hypothetical protein